MPEKLIFDGERHVLCATPLRMYFESTVHEIPFTAPHSACWRGYQGTWEVKGERLYIISLDGYLKDGTKANLETVFPDSNGQVFAVWFTGTLRAPTGRVLDHRDGLCGSLYERDLILTFEEGILTSRRILVNGKASDLFDTD